MGRRISKDRIRTIRQQKNKIIIAVEGKNKTEKLYFDNFDNGKQSYSITIAKGNDTDPLKLVKSLSKEIVKRDLDLLHKDMAFCVFDTDEDSNKNKLIIETKKLEKYQSENGKSIGTVEANPSTEMYQIVEYLIKNS